ncbi:MAG TPA: histidine kinase dimerization/phosphoacceptor domain -containing protein [Pirellulales bacterium]|nr:histidine kinase dimerization/phosphoacceptor domain -containing protein [Pirellulales bacterium]
MPRFPRDVTGYIQKHRFLAYSISVLSVAVASAVTFYVEPLHEAPTDLYFAAIVVTAWLCGKWPAILATALSTLAVDYFIIPPIFSILLDFADLTRFVIFASVALSICYLQDRYKQAANRLREANDVLEARVQERTATLATANEALLNEIKERQAAEDALIQSEANLRLALGSTELSLKEKEVLNRELNHRVKNNLQIISSLLSIQSSKIQGRENQEIFKECQHRIRAIALVHQRLCGAANLTSIDISDYFGKLVQELFRSYYVGRGQVTPHVTVEALALGIDRLVPCALIVNELVCNAFKYAFPDGKSGEVSVELRRADDRISLSVRDNGIGFSPKQAPQRSSVGLQIVRALVDQLSGELQWTNGCGTGATVTFPEIN